MLSTKKILLSTALLFNAATVAALPIYDNAEVVGSVTNTATFDSIYTGLSLHSYTEDGITLTLADSAYEGFDAFNRGRESNFHYGSGGNNSWVTIAMEDNSRIYSLDFLLGDGWSNRTTTSNLIWETFDGSTSTGFGDVNAMRGSTAGWTDTSGFTSIRVAASSGNIDSFGQFQAIALDNLRVGAASVPEPGTLGLLGLGVLALGVSRRTKVSQS